MFEQKTTYDCFDSARIDAWASIHRSDIAIETVTDWRSVATEWQALERHSNDPFSGYRWCSAWYAAHESERHCSPLVVIGRSRAGALLFVLPLFLVRRFGFRILTQPCRGHAPYYTGIFTPECRRAVSADGSDDFWSRVISALPDVDLISIDGIPDIDDERDNPLFRLPLVRSDNPSFRMSPGADWNRFYEARTASKDRSNDRRRPKRLAETGTVTCGPVPPDAGRKQAGDAIFALKNAQFRSAGVVDPFRSERIRRFYAALLRKPPYPTGDPVHLTALALDGRMIAGNLGIRHQTAYYGLVMAMADDEMRRFAPGRHLLIQTCADLCADGVRDVDFGAGDSPYKQDWCDITVERYRAVVTRGVKGRLLAALFRTFETLKTSLKGTALCRFATSLIAVPVNRPQPAARARCGNSEAIPCADASQTPASVISPVTSRAGVTSKA